MKKLVDNCLVALVVFSAIASCVIVFGIALYLVDPALVRETASLLGYREFAGALFALGSSCLLGAVLSTLLPLKSESVSG